MASVCDDWRRCDGVRWHDLRAVLSLVSTSSHVCILVAYFLWKFFRERKKYLKILHREKKIPNRKKSNKRNNYIIKNNPPLNRGSYCSHILMREIHKKGYSCCTPIKWWFVKRFIRRLQLALVLTERDIWVRPGWGAILQPSLSLNLRRSPMLSGK